MLAKLIVIFVKVTNSSIKLFVNVKIAINHVKHVPNLKIFVTHVMKKRIYIFIRIHVLATALKDHIFKFILKNAILVKLVVKNVNLTDVCIVYQNGI
jgi:hypothetical protein